MLKKEIFFLLVILISINLIYAGEDVLETGSADDSLSRYSSNYEPDTDDIYLQNGDGLICYQNAPNAGDSFSFYDDGSAFILNLTDYSGQRINLTFEGYMFQGQSYRNKSMGFYYGDACSVADTSSVLKSMQGYLIYNTGTLVYHDFFVSNSNPYVRFVYYHEGSDTSNSFAWDYYKIDVLTTSISVILDSPNEGFGSTSATNSFSADFTASTGDLLENSTLYLWNSTNSIINTTLSLINGTTNSTNISLTLPYEDNFKWNYYACDNSSGCGWGINRTLIYDITPPTIEITYPTNTTYNKTISKLNYTYNDANPGYCWYSLNNGATNSSTVSSGTNWTGLSSSPEGNNWKVYCNDSSGNQNVGSISFRSKIPAIEVNVISPTTNLNVTQNGTFTVTVNVSCRNANCGNINVTLDPRNLITNGGFELGDLTNWKTGGNADWDVQGTTKIEGNYAAKAGTITHNQISRINTTVTLSDFANLTFYWKVSSETNYDYLLFCNTTSTCTRSSGYKTRISGDVNWQQKKYVLPPGTHTLHWAYGKDGSVNSRDDTGWIDNVTILQESSKNVVSNVIGDTPFYTIDLNPRNISLDEDKSTVITWKVNATGTINQNFTFFVYANQTANLSFGGMSHFWNVTIVNGTVEDLTNPITSLSSPGASYSNGTSDPIQISFQCSATDNSGLSNTSLYLTNKQNLSFTLNTTTTLTGTSDSATWKYNLSNGNYTWNCLTFDTSNNKDWGDSNRSVIINFTDNDGDGNPDSEDNLEGNISSVNLQGISNLNISIGGNSSLINFEETKEVVFYDSTTKVINFTHNFSSTELDLNKITILKDSNTIVVNLSNQLQSGINKTLYIPDNNFVSLCVKDDKISSLSGISSSCDLANETDFTSCLGNDTGIEINSIICTDEGDLIKVENLKYSGIKGTSPTSSSPRTTGGGSGSTGYQRIKEIISSSGCSSDAECNLNEGEKCKEGVCVKLFDILILDFNKSIKAGEFFEFTYLLKGMADISDDVEVFFWISKNNEKYTDGKDVVYMGNLEEKTKQTKLLLPSELESGVYELHVKLNYGLYEVEANRKIELNVDNETEIITIKEYEPVDKTKIVVLTILILSILYYLFNKMPPKKRKKLLKQIKSSFRFKKIKKEKWMN